MKFKEEEFITWTNKLSCGIKLIDDQHKALVDLINEMFNHVTGNHPQERDYFNRAIKEIVNYVKTHFTTEEKILRATNYPDYAEHKKEHDSFIHAIIENSKDYNSGGRHTLSTLIRFLRDWVLSHIAIMDKQYVEYMKKTARLKEDGTLVIDVKGD